MYFVMQMTQCSRRSHITLRELNNNIFNYYSHTFRISSPGWLHSMYLSRSPSMDSHSYLYYIITYRCKTL